LPTFKLFRGVMFRRFGCYLIRHIVGLSREELLGAVDKVGNSMSVRRQLAKRMIVLRDASHRHFDIAMLQRRAWPLS
jgi:hypothetical protein